MQNTKRIKYDKYWNLFLNVWSEKYNHFYNHRNQIIKHSVNEHWLLLIIFLSLTDNIMPKFIEYYDIELIIQMNSHY